MLKTVLFALVGTFALAGCTGKQIDAVSRDVNAVNAAAQGLGAPVATVAGATGAPLGATIAVIVTSLTTLIGIVTTAWQTIAKSGILTQLTLHQQALGAVVNAVEQTSPEVQAAVKTEVAKAMAGNKDALNPIVDSVKA